jgi:hypothetical protein
MTHTEIQLVCVYGPVVPLAEVSRVYFGLSYAEAAKKAALNRLPVATFRMTASQKAPLMVHASDLAAYIDATHEKAQREWEKSQV